MYDLTDSPKAILYANIGRSWVGIVESSMMSSQSRSRHLLT